MAKWWNPSVEAGDKRLTFWPQVLIAVAFYVVYSLVGDVAKASRTSAVDNAIKEINLERSLGLYFEQHLQRVTLNLPNLIKFANLYYVTVHFVLPVVILVLLFRRSGVRFRMYRNVFAILTILGFLVYLVDPVAPPRLLPHAYHFIDTQAVYGGAGNLDATLMKEGGDPYAAMPSLHFAWALWCTIAGWGIVRSWWAKTLLFIHPLLTIWVVIVTANHLAIEIVAGAVALWISMLVAGAFRPIRRGWWSQAQEASASRHRVVFVNGLRTT
ncbi:MAG: phosphatase PAP2 family protein [Acidimicrobiales bacterium]